MIELLGKRPFAGREDDMDKWLDENRKTGVIAPTPAPEHQPPAEDGPLPNASAVASKALE